MAQILLRQLRQGQAAGQANSLGHCRRAGGWWLVSAEAGGWWLVSAEAGGWCAGGWWLVSAEAGGWWLVAGERGGWCAGALVRWCAGERGGWWLVAGALVRWCAGALVAGALVSASVSQCGASGIRTGQHHTTASPSRTRTSLLLYSTNAPTSLVVTARFSDCRSYPAAFALLRRGVSVARRLASWPGWGP